MKSLELACLLQLVVKHILNFELHERAFMINIYLGDGYPSLCISNKYCGCVDVET